MGAAGAAGLAVINSGQPTFVRRGGSATVIDLTLVSERCSYEWQRAPDTAGSDHYPISLSPVRPSRGATRVYTVVRWPKFREFCAETPRGDDFFAHIAECANRASSRVAVPAGSPCPDIKLLNVRAARRRAQRRAIRSGRMSDWTLYNRLDAVCRRHACQLRRRSWARLCSSLAEPSNERRGWRVLRALLNPKTPRFPVQAIAIARGISELELAEILADVFAASAPASSAPTVVLRALYAAVFVRGEAHSNHAEAITSLCESDFTHHELQRALSRGRRCRSAPGADGITRKMLRNLDEPQRRLLLDAYNDVLHSGSLPDSWRHAVVVPVLKRGKPPHSPASYRPISLTSIPGKTMEAMALSRLQWIADARGALPPEQCGFRAHRSTADCIAVVVGTLEQARLQRQAAFLLLLDIQSAFDCLPHDTILSSVRALGVEGRLLAYIEAFLAGRTAAVRVGGTVGSPRPVNCGVPQGSVLSPFLFNLALAPIIECIPKTGRFPVRAVLYADDIALFVRGPPSATAAMRNQLQAALDIVANFLRAIGLRLSSTKSEAILIHPRSVRRHTGCILVDGVPLPWRLTVRYLGLTIDSRLSWLAAVSRLRAEMRRVESAVRALLARGDGCPSSFAAALYSAVALPKVLYALPLCRVSARLWKLIDGDHRRVLRMCHGLPRSSRIAETLAETGAWPVSLTADLRALGHLERLSRAPDAGPILFLLRSLRQSRVGTVCELFDSLVVDTPPVPPSWPPPHQRAPLHVRLGLPGVRSKHRTPLCAVQQEAAARIEDDLGGRTHLYADGSVLVDGSAAAACVAPDLGISRQCRLSYRASSTTAELAGLHLAADILEESPHITSAAILCDSRAALQQLLLDERGPPLAQRLACRLHALQSSCDLRLQWIPSHVGVAGNETADQLARRAHNPSTALTARVSSIDTARLLFRRELVLRHPDDRVAEGRPPCHLPQTGFTRRERAFLLALRTGSVWPAERRHRLRGAPSPLCGDCGAIETLQHLISPEVPLVPPADGSPAGEEPHVSVPLPSSDDMDLTSSRKRARETESDDDEDAMRRKQPLSAPASSEQQAAASTHVEKGDQGSAILLTTCATAASPSRPAAQEGAPAESASAISRHPAELDAASFEPPPSEGAPDSSLGASSAPEGGARPAASSASEPAGNQSATDAMELTDEAPAGASQQNREHPAAQFLKGPPRQPASRPKPKGKNQQRKHRKEPAALSPSPAVPAATPNMPVASLQGAAPPARELNADGFTLVRSRGDRRRAQALETAAIPVDPAVIGTVLFRPSAPGGAFKGAPRLELAATLSSRAGVAAVRVNHRRNIVAADTTTRECQEELLAITELRGISVTARLPAVRGQSTGTPEPFQAWLQGEAGQAPPGAVPPVRPLRARAGILQLAVRLHFLRQEPYEGRLLPDGSLQELRRPPQGRHSRLPQMARRTPGGHDYGFIHRSTIKACRQGSGPEEQQPSTSARSYASALKGPSPAPKRPVPAPRAPRRQETQNPAPPGQTTVDQLVANLLVTMQAVGAMLPADHPLRTICL
nr:uncharacterized protein LOC129382122 [Dermacentor andersoni]